MVALIPHTIATAFEQSERRGPGNVVALFADISGFTPLTEALMHDHKAGAELLTASINQVFHPLVTTVYACGGFISTFLGDAFIALFPLASDATMVAHEALRTAEVIRQIFVAHGVVTTATGAFPLTVKVGLAAGPVVWEIIMADEHRESAALRHTAFFRGAAIDHCVAAEARAQAGDLIISASLYQLLLNADVVAEPINDSFVRVLHSPYTGTEPAEPPGFPQAPTHTTQQAFVPDALLNLLSNGVRGEFRQVVAIFVSISSTLIDPDLHAFIALTLRLTHIHGGYFNRVSFGDKGGMMLILFGAPTAHERQTHHAAAFLLALRDQTPTIAWRAGATIGTAYAGLVGGEIRAEYTAMGDTINLAARLMSKAPWGSIWLSETLAAAIGPADCTLTPVGTFTVKGRKQPVAVVNLSAAASVQPPHSNSDIFIGRQAELHQLQSWLAPIFTGQFAGLLVLMGEAGVGKSHLVAHLSRQLSGDPPITWLHSDAATLIPQAFGAIRRLLRNYLTRPFEQMPDAKRDWFDTLINTLIGVVAPSHPTVARELDRTRSFLGALLGLHWPGSLYEQVDAPLRLLNTQQAILALLRAESVRQPVIVVLDDVHALDDESQATLATLVRGLEGCSVAILATARTTSSAAQLPLFLHPLTRQILYLEALGLEETTRLLRVLLGGNVAPATIAWMQAKTGGNPLFLEHLTLDRRERGGLVQDENAQWVLAQLELDDIPTRLQDVLVARLDRLPFQVRQVVQVASVLGQEFTVPVLAHMHLPEETVAEWVRSAADAGIWTIQDGNRYQFRHALLRDAAYEMQLYARRRILHAQAAAAIASIYAADLAPQYANLVYHYGQAEDVPREREYAGLAGEWAAAQYANAEAVRHVSHALTLTAADAVAEHARLLTVREQVYDRQGNREAQAADLAALTVAADQLDERWQALVALRHAEYGAVTSDYAAALHQVEQARHQAQQADTPDLIIHSDIVWGEILIYQSDYTAARTRLEQALAAAHLHNLPRLAAACLRHLGRASYVQGDYDAAHRYSSRALAQYQADDDRQGAARTLKEIGNVELDRGNYTTAQQYYDQSLAICRAIGDRHGESLALHNLGLTANFMNQYATAITYYEQEVVLCREMGDESGVGFTLGSLGVTYLDQGQYTAALDYLQQSLTICQRLGDQHGVGIALANLGLLCQYLGAYATAEQHYQQTLAVYESTGNQSGMAGIFAWQGLCAHQQGDQQAAYAQCRRAIHIAEQIDNFQAGVYARLYLGHTLTALHRLAEANTAYQEALQAFVQLGHTTVGSTEAWAGLARIALAEGDLPAAQQAIAPVLAHLERAPQLPGTDEPLRVYLTCYQVLSAADDAQADELLAQAHTLLHTRASTIADPHLRHSFLHAVPAHRDLLTLAKVVG